MSAETDETRGLTNSELQRLVLLEQLKLIRMQQNKLLEKERERQLLRLILKLFYHIEC